MAGFQVDLSPLERSSRYIGESLASAGQTIGDSMQRSQQKEEQQQSQEQVESLLRQSMSGDPEAFKELMVKSPQAAQMVAEQLQNQKASQQGDEDRFQGQMAEDTAGFIEQMHLAPEEQQEAMFNAAIDDPRYDIDEEDRNSFMDVNARKAIISKVISPEYADNLFGEQGSQKKTTKQRDFQTYQDLKKTDKEAAKMFAVGAGFLEDNNKKVFQIVDGMKIFSDGSEEAINANSELKSPDMRAATSRKKALKIIDKAREGQLKNAGFAITMNNGVNSVNKMVEEGYDPTSAAWVNKYLAGTTIGNLVMSDDDQTFVGSVEQMINAIARRETGAAITEFEKKDFFNRYMPVAGDKPQRIKQKKQALERQFKSIRGQAGSAYEAIRVTQGFDDKTKTPEVTNKNWADL